MDTLTHALSGVLLAQSVGRPVDARGRRSWLIAAGVAAAFPDIDFALLLLDPLRFLVLHRGPTHSLLLLPLWAMLLAAPLSRILKLSWTTTVAACAIGLFAHVIGDWVTLYGTRLLYPLDDRAFALGISFDVSPWIAVVTIAGFLLCRLGRPRPTAVVTLALIGMLLLGQSVLRHQAIQVAADHARAHGLDVQTIQALPQPLSPFHWALLLSDADGYELAYLDLVGAAPVALPAGTWLAQMQTAYRAGQHLAWTRHERPTHHALAREAWEHPAFRPFREFALSPALLRVETEGAETCAWFTDMRHRLPLLAPPFRYGLCRLEGEHGWRPYRFGLLTTHVRHAL